MSISSLAPRVPTRDVLTRSEAEGRAARISDVAYVLHFDLLAKESTYRATAQLDFALSDTTPSLFIDHRGATIERLVVNGQEVAPRRDGDRLILESALLAPRMSLVMDYSNGYDEGGDGLHHFIDPEDGTEYLYSNLQPFSAHRLFPCFDQPDLKATYLVTVDAPAGWTVISNEEETSNESLADGRIRHRFGHTPPFSTYLFALLAGPFRHVHSTRADGTRLGLYCRDSLWPYLEADAGELFQLTGQGFDFFIELFDQPFPFTKYDQLFVPEFNAGAMENVGAVTFSEVYVFRDPATEAQRQTRAEVILHELAHMWFGDLVTMRWWDDLWLNESFASYISFLALTEATRFKGAWKAFARQLKRWAYRQDQLPTTHPIAGTARDTDAALMDFDGITYGKGASVLKQLVATIERDALRAGMRTYFRRHAWGNATLGDFLAALEDASGLQLAEWARLWLRTPSLNTIAADWQAQDGQLTTLRLIQTAPADHPTLRPHRLSVGLLTDSVAGIEVDSIDATIAGAEQDIPAVRGRPRPALVFPNLDDHAYAKIALDKVSLDFARLRVTDIADPLTRELLWGSLWEMVRDGGLASTDYLATVRERISQEPDAELVEALLERVQATLRWYVPEKWREREAGAIARVCLDQAFDSAGDARITWLRAAIATSATATQLAPLLALADADGADGPVLDQRMRWDVAVKAVAFGVSDGEARIATESTRDPSDRGQRTLIRARSAAPTAQAKEEAWERMTGPGYGSFHLTRAAMEGFAWPSQSDLLAAYRGPFFDGLRHIYATHDHPFAIAFLTFLFPSQIPDEDAAARARRLLSELATDEVLLRRELTEALDDVERALRVRAVAEQSTGSD